MEPAQVYEATSLGGDFKKTRILEMKENEGIFLGQAPGFKIMVRLQDASKHCQLTATTFGSRKEYIVMILGEKVAAQYRISQEDNTLDRVPSLVNLFEKEIEIVTGNNPIKDKGYRVVLASRENESDPEYRRIYYELGKQMEKKFGYVTVTCLQYQDRSVLRAAFMGDPKAWAYCGVDIVGDSKRELKQINYLEMKPSQYSLDN